jgi:hypothetical protein
MDLTHVKNIFGDGCDIFIGSKIIIMTCSECEFNNKGEVFHCFSTDKHKVLCENDLKKYNDKNLPHAAYYETCTGCIIDNNMLSCEHLDSYNDDIDIDKRFQCISNSESDDNDTEIIYED